MANLNGCYNLPRPVAGAITHQAQAGWSETFRDGFGVPHRSPVYVDIKHVMTTECQYTKTTPDPRCAGCSHEKAYKAAAPAPSARRHKPVTPGIVGHRFGKLTVLCHVSAAEARAAGGKYPHFVAQCDCGNTVHNKNAADFKSGRANSCGCTVRKVKRKATTKRLTGNTRAALDVTGQRYGILTAVSLSGFVKQGAVWLFKCDCGNEREIRLKDVRHGNTASCGCLKAGKGQNKAGGNGKGWRSGQSAVDVNRPWRKDEQIDDRYLVLVGERCPKSA